MIQYFKSVLLRLMENLNVLLGWDKNHCQPNTHEKQRHCHAPKKCCFKIFIYKSGLEISMRLDPPVIASIVVYMIFYFVTISQQQNLNSKPLQTV